MMTFVVEKSRICGSTVHFVLYIYKFVVFFDEKKKELFIL